MHLIVMIYYVAVYMCPGSAMVPWIQHGARVLDVAAGLDLMELREAKGPPAV
jgi:hypothetical protein